MKRSLLVPLFSIALPAFPFVLGGCANDLDAKEVNSGDEATNDLGQPPLEDLSSDLATRGSRIHFMPLHRPGEQAIAPQASNTLTYYGGPVLSAVNVIPVYWNSSVAYQSNLNGFYTGVPNSVHYDMLKQYSSIGRGTRGKPYVDSRTTANVTEASVQSELNRLFSGGLIPAPAANNYYPVHFPAGMSITASDGSKSCVIFCAFHGTYVRNGVNVNYAIIPDQGGGCAGGCGGNSQRVNNLTSVAAYEMVAATTDPAVGLATYIGPPLAWYNTTYGEIGDICLGQQGTVIGGDGVTYVVQKEWSNSKNACAVN